MLRNVRRAISWLNFGGLNRSVGTQNPNPGDYAAESPEPVTFDTAMTMSVWWAGVRLLSETIASMDVHFESVGADGSVSPMTGDVVDVFGLQPNRYQTRFEFMETMTLNLVTRGNAYALKQRNDRGQLIGLLPIMSSEVETRLMEDGSIAHIHYHSGGVTAYSEDSIWHVKLFGNGVIGLSPLGHARNSLGIGLAAERRVSQIYRNGGKPAGVLMIDATLNQEARNGIRQEFKELREGNGDRLMVLEADMKYQQVSMTPQDIELLQSRRFQLEDIARFVGVPSVLVNDTSGTTVWGSGISEIVRGFYTLNLRPYLIRYQHSMKAHLFSTRDQRGGRARFDFDALTATDIQARFNAYKDGVGGGFIMPDEARKKEGLPSAPGGDRLYINGSYVPLTDARTPVVRPDGRQ